MADDLRCAMCGGRGSETAVYTGEKIQVYTAVLLGPSERDRVLVHVTKSNRDGDVASYAILHESLALHPRCTHDWLAEHQDQALAAGPGAW